MKGGNRLIREDGNQRRNWKWNDTKDDGKAEKMGVKRNVSVSDLGSVSEMSD